ncbi:MAG: hypothetical protein AAGJ40_14435 [Planctomycetota bacterium]
MSRGRNPIRSHCVVLRRRGGTALVAVMVLLFACHAGQITREVSAEDEIMLVVGKQLTGGRRSTSARTRSSSSSGSSFLNGLFGGSSAPSSSSADDDDEYRKVTPIPREEPADWSGIPYHATNGKRVASGPAAPINDPGARPSTVARKTSPAPVGSGTQPRTATRQAPADLPRPPVASTARKITQPTKISTNRRPSPLSVSDSSSSRRQRSATVVTPIPTKPSIRVRDDAELLNDEIADLVPKVSRRVLQVAPVPTATTKLSENKSSRRSKPEPTSAPEPTSVTKSPAPKTTKAVEPKTAAPKVVRTPLPQRTASKTKTPSKTLAPARSNQASSLAAKTAPTEPAPNAPTTQIAAQPTLESKQPLGPKPAINPVPELSDKPAVAAIQTPVVNNPAAPAESSATPAGPTASQTVASTATDANEDTAIIMPKMSTFGGNRPNGAQTASASPNAMADSLTSKATVTMQPIAGKPAVVAKPNGAISPSARPNSFAKTQDAFTNRRAVPSSLPTPTQTTGFGNNANMSGLPSTNAPSATIPNTMRPNRPSSRIADGFASSNRDTHSDGFGPNDATVASELPGIRIVTAGPRQIMIRQTHAYEIRAENRGSIDASGLIVRAHVPDWADVVGHQSSAGKVAGDTSGSTRTLVWNIDQLAAGQSQSMFVRLKAARSGTHDVNVDWTLAPQEDRVQVHVAEPQLAITIDGPEEVVFGESKTYTIRVLNPGDGIAPAVVFTLSPNSSTPQSQRIGDIPAGKEAQFEVELTAQDLGELKIHGLAVGDLELNAEADKTVRVLAANLEATLSGPELKYQNTEGMYQLELTNRGTTASDDVVAMLTLPMGVTYLGGMEGASLTGDQLRWEVASLGPGASKSYQFNVMMDATGNQEFVFDCKGSAAGQTSVALVTNVEAIADLVLSINDPTAPAPIGEDVEYEITIRNRGSKPATDVRAIAQFSHGIEPVAIRGHQGKVITGQVLIEPIQRIEAGQDVRMTIVARAEDGGHHRFRTEVRSGDTMLVAEEATHYMNARNERISRRSDAGENKTSLPMR